MTESPARMIPPKRRPLPWIAAILLAVSFLPARARAFTSVTLPDSVKAVEQAPAGPVNPHRPRIVRQVLKAAETAAPLGFEVNLKMRNIPELQARIARGERISAQEMAARYEPIAADYERVAAWLTTQGLAITRRDSHHMALFARGSVSQVRQALQVTFARVALEGREYTSAITAPSVPAGLSPLLIGINGLQPHIQAHRHIVRRQDLPDASSSSGANYLPKQIAAAYNATALYNNDILGSGQSIAIVIDTFPVPGDLVAFWKDAGVSQSIENIQFIQAVPGTLPEASGEETLDTEWSSSIAPSAQVRVYAATDFAGADLDQAYQQVLDDATNHPALGIHQMSMSYGYGESYTTKSQVDADDQFFMELTNAGVTVFASSGDDGSTPGPEGTGDESGPVQVDSPASDPYVAGVGGTTLVLNAQNAETSESVWNENGGASGGGYSEYFTRSGWQTGTGVSTVNKRQVPDIAAAANPEYGGVIVQGGVEQTVGGTSWSSPTWAAFCALINQARANSGKGPIGLIAQYLYPLINSPDYSATYTVNFRDIVTGNNATQVSHGNYSATTGYDLCTGLGAPLVQPLAEFLTGTSALVGLQNPAPVQSVVPGGAASFTAGVGGASASYQWQRMPIGTSAWSNLTDGGAYTGSATATLTITGATTAMSGDQFQCIVTIGSGTLTTAPPSVLVVDSPLAVTKLAGQVGVIGHANGSGNAAQFNYPAGVAVDGSNNIYVADFGNNQIRKITSAGVVSTPYGSVNGSSGSANGTGNSALFNTPNAVAIDGSNNIYVADTGNNIIRKITGGVVHTLAGPSAGFNSPEGIAVDSAGNVYVADTGNDTIREITPDGAVSTLAGQTGSSGYADGSATTQALFNMPAAVAVDSFGNVYVADFGNSVVREISAGAVTTIAGQAGTAGYLDGLGPNALFDAPVGLAIDGSNNLYIADAQVPVEGTAAAGSDVLRRLTPAGVVSTIAGNPGTTGATNGTGLAAEFDSLQGVAVAPSGSVYLGDTYNQTIRAGAPTASGTGVTVTKIISLGGNLAFGDVAVGQTGTNTLTINNTGNTVLTVSGISYPTGFGGDWSSGTVPAGGSQTVNVTFAPATEQSYGGSIAVSSDATAGNASIATSGTGVLAASPPAVTTGAVTGIGGTAATLGGTVNPHGSSTTVYFNYGTTPSLGSVSTSINAGLGNTNVGFSIDVGGLAPNTPYYFEAVASNAAGSGTGAMETFTTLAFSTSPVVATGTSATGVPGAAYSAFGNPAINGLDYIAFEGTLASRSSITASDNSGIWAENSLGALELVARTGNLAPGAGGALFSKLSNPVYNDAEAVAFFGTLKVARGLATASTETGIWSNTTGLPALVAREGSPAPGDASGGKFRKFISLGLPDQGGVLFLASLSNGRLGIWAGDSSSDLQMITEERTVFTGNGQTISLLSFLPTLPYVQGQTRSFAQATGDLVYGVTFTDKTSGIVEVAGTTSQLIVQSQQSAPGLSGAEFSAFGSPAINANDDIAFEGTLTRGIGGITAGDNAGIWADGTNGMLELVTQTGASAPGTGATFETLGDPVYNDNECVAFRATLASSSGASTKATSAGIWSNSSGTLELVAREGYPAPGAGGATFKAFNGLALPDQGGVVLLATLNANRAFGITSASNTGIWAVDTAGTLQLVVKTGDVVGNKIITSLSFLPILSYVGGQSRNVTQGVGDLIYQATFNDKSSGIFTVIFP